MFLRALAVLLPGFRRVSMKNITLVFPDSSAVQRSELFDASLHSLARFIVDSARFHTLDRAWTEAHVEVPFREGYLELKRRHAGRGVLVVSGHLGSIEIQALCAPFVGRSFSFVARDLKHRRLDAWWRRNREQFGNEVISRKGAVARILENLRAGKDVAILVDQNVKREHALFIDWFGRPAATTFAAGRVAVETRAPVVLSAIRYIGNERYRIDEEECNLEHIYDAADLSFDEKVLATTQILSERYQKLILAAPEQWFWMHRRWKTAPEGMPEDFYSTPLASPARG